MKYEFVGEAMDIKFQKNQLRKEQNDSPKFLSLPIVEIVRNFHESFPQYKPTPLANLKTLAKAQGIGGIFVKDESHRFGLNAFKVLGGSFAIGKYMAKQLNVDMADLKYNELVADATKQKLGSLTFATTTDGNHGRGVAWTAQQLGQKSVVYMPKGTQQIRLDNIKKLGADACILDMNYDEAVRYTAQQAQEKGWVVVQDTAWVGYEEIPVGIMQGYGTMAFEALEQLRAVGIEEPTHIFVQAGVGSMAAAVHGFFANACVNKPVTVVVEACNTECFYNSIVAGDGQARSVGGDLQTIMAGLACGEVNSIAWDILRDGAELFAVCPDRVAANGMRVLGNPVGDDPRVVSGESGAVTTGLLYDILSKPELAWVKEELGLDEQSVVLLFSTEGDTDPVMYRKIVWEGRYHG